MKTISVVILLGAMAWAQENTGQRVTVPFSDPARPKTVRGHMLNACFAVEGYDGKEVIVEAKNRGSERERRSPRGAEGMRRIDTNNFGVTIEEENNVVKISSSMGSSSDLIVKVPVATSLKLECTNGGDLSVDHVSGDLELNNLNGKIRVSNVSGSVLAHSLNGSVVVGLDQVVANKPMSFSTMNGNIDVTLPGDIKANVKMKSDNGEVYTDFDVKLLPNAIQPVVEDSRKQGGKYKVKVDKTTVGTINGGGPEITFTTFNGNIYIRKKK